MKTMLLHACCAPCATAVIERLKPMYNITVYYYNPNIYPTEEYNKRKDELLKLCKIHNLPLKIGEYDNISFNKMCIGQETCPEGGARCTLCIGKRLEETAKYAKGQGYDCFCSTLSVSPHKNAKLINELGNFYSQKYEVEYIENDFKKQNGFLRTIELCKEYNIYRQNYCGCKFSIWK